MADYSSFTEAIQAAQRVSVQTLLSKGQKVDSQWGFLIEQFKGHVPYGLACVRIGVESGGNQNAGPTSCCGETGLLQVWMGKGWTQGPGKERLGLKCSKSISNFNPFDPVQNLQCGFAGWNDDAYKLKKSSIGNLFPSPDWQFWSTVNAGMSAGAPLVANVIKSINPRSGHVAEDVAAFIQQKGEGLANINFGSKVTSSYAKTATYRILKDFTVTPSAYSKIKDPSPVTGFGYPFSLTPQAGTSSSVISLALIGGAAWYLWQRLR